MPCRLTHLGLTLLIAGTACAASATDLEAAASDAVSTSVVPLNLGYTPFTALPVQVRPTVPEEPVRFVPKGSIDTGIGFHSLTAGQQNWNSQFVRGVYASDPKNTWTGEVSHMRQFGSTGTLFVAGNTHVLNDDWYMATSLATSSGGFFLPRYRIDMVANRKFLEPRNLVIGAGLSSIKAKDEHKDLAVLLSAAYYFESPWVIEGAVRINRSNPGSVLTSYYTVAATYGRDKKRYISLRLAAGREGYQLVSDTGNALANFSSQDAMLTWREWVGRDWGFQARLGAYHNPYYRRIGGEFGLFLDF